MTSSETGYGMLTTAVANKDDAEKIARMVLDAKLAACVQVLPIHSYYTWKGKVADEAEFLLLVKTRTALFDEAIQAIKSAHPYETPEIVATEFAAGFPGYFSWIDEVTK